MKVEINIFIYKNIIVKLFRIQSFKLANTTLSDILICIHSNTLETNLNNYVSAVYKTKLDFLNWLTDSNFRFVHVH